MKIGIAGCGFMGDVHAEKYKLLGYNIYAIAEMNTTKREIFVKKYSPEKIYNDVYDMILDKDIELIDICLPTPFHTTPAIEALNANKNVLLEKPIALTISEALKIKEAAKNSNGKFMVAHVLRFWSQYTVIKNLFNNGNLSDVKEVYASRFNELPLWSEGSWIMDEKKSGGLVIDLMIHDIDFIMWNLGKVKQVQAKGIPDKNNFSVHVMATIEFENNAIAYIEGGYLNPKGSGLNSQMRVYAKDSKVEMFSHENFLRFNKQNSPLEKIPNPDIDGYFEEVTYFIDCIKNGKEPTIVTIDSAIDSLNVSLALQESLHTNSKVIKIR